MVSNRPSYTRCASDPLATIPSRSGPLPKVGISRAIPRRQRSNPPPRTGIKGRHTSSTSIGRSLHLEDPRLSNRSHSIPTTSPYHRSSSGQAVPPKSHFPSTITTNTTTTPTPQLKSINLIETAIQSTTEHITSELVHLRGECAKALVTERLRFEKERAQNRKLKKERDFAWARMKMLMASTLSKVGGPDPGHHHSHSHPSPRRARSCGLSVPRPSTSIPIPSRVHRHQDRPVFRSSSNCDSPTVYAHDGTLLLSRAPIQIKQEEEPISLTSSPPSSSSSSSSSAAASSSSLSGWSSRIRSPDNSDLWALRYPDIDSVNSPASSSSPQSLLSLSTSPKIEEVSSSSSLSSPTTTFTGDHLKVAFRELHGHAVCRMCILQRKQGSKPGNLPHSPKRLPLMSFPLHTPPFDLFEHCLEHHAKETIELVGLSKSTLTQMQAGFAKTERVEDAHAYRDMLFPSYRS